MKKMDSVEKMSGMDAAVRQSGVAEIRLGKWCLVGVIASSYALFCAFAGIMDVFVRSHGWRLGDSASGWWLIYQNGLPFEDISILSVVNALLIMVMGVVSWGVARNAREVSSKRLGYGVIAASLLAWFIMLVSPVLISGVVVYASEAAMKVVQVSACLLVVSSVLHGWVMDKSLRDSARAKASSYSSFPIVALWGSYYLLVAALMGAFGAIGSAAVYVSVVFAMILNRFAMLYFFMYVADLSSRSNKADAIVGDSSVGKSKCRCSLDDLVKKAAQGAKAGKAEAERSEQRIDSWCVLGCMAAFYLLVAQFASSQGIWGGALSSLGVAVSYCYSHLIGLAFACSMAVVVYRLAKNACRVAQVNADSNLLVGAMVIWILKAVQEALLASGLYKVIGGVFSVAASVEFIILCCSVVCGILLFRSVLPALAAKKGRKVSDWVLIAGWGAPLLKDAAMLLCSVIGLSQGSESLVMWMSIVSGVVSIAFLIYLAYVASGLRGDAQKKESAVA